MRRDLTRVKAEVANAAQIDRNEAATYLELLHDQDCEFFEQAQNGSLSRDLQNRARRQASKNDAESVSPRVIAGNSLFAPASHPSLPVQDEPRAPHPWDHQCCEFGQHAAASPLPMSEREQVGILHEGSTDHAQYGAVRASRMPQLREGSAEAATRPPSSKRWSRVLPGLKLARSPSRSG